MSLIVARDVWKTYTTAEVEVPAVQGVSAQLRRRSLPGVCGPSGSGKTTLLQPDWLPRQARAAAWTSPGWT